MPKYIAVVYRNGGSRRAEGSFECFVADDPATAIDQGVEFARKWARRGNGPYRVLAGELTHEAKLDASVEFDPPLSAKDTKSLTPAQAMALGVLEYLGAEPKE